MIKFASSSEKKSYDSDLLLTTTVSWYSRSNMQIFRSTVCLSTHTGTSIALANVRTDSWYIKNDDVICIKWWCHAHRMMMLYTKNDNVIHTKLQCWTHERTMLYIKSNDITTCRSWGPSSASPPIQGRWMSTVHNDNWYTHHVDVNTNKMMML